MPVGCRLALFAVSPPSLGVPVGTFCGPAALVGAAQSGIAVCWRCRSALFAVSPPSLGRVPVGTFCCLAALVGAAQSGGALCWRCRSALFAVSPPSLGRVPVGTFCGLAALVGGAGWHFLLSRRPRWGGSIRGRSLRAVPEKEFFWGFFSKKHCFFVICGV